MVHIVAWRTWHDGRVVLKLDGDEPERLHIQLSNDPNMLADEGRRVATIRPDHFLGKKGVSRKLWLERGEGFLALFRADGRCLARKPFKLNRKPFSVQALRNAAQADQISVLEAIACLNARGVQDAYKVAAHWAWSVAPIVDALASPFSVEREAAVRLLRQVRVSLLNEVCCALLKQSIHPDRLGSQASAFANLVSQRACGQDCVDRLLERPEWLKLLDPTSNPTTWNDEKLREAINGDWQKTEWRAALQMVAARMATAQALDLLLPQTHRAALDEASRSYLIKQSAVLLRRLQWQDLQTHTAQLFSDLINRSSLGLEARSTLLAALLDCAEGLLRACALHFNVQQQIKRWLYGLAQPIQTWCQAALQSPTLENAQLAARAASLCQNPQLQGVLVAFLERTERLPAAQAALFRALGDIRAEETSHAEPLAHRFADALRHADAGGKHEAALYALERFLPYENSRSILELIRDVLNRRLHCADTPRLVRLLATHALFDLNNIATDALIKGAVDHSEWRQAIIETWQRVPDPHFVRGNLLRALPKDANLRQWLQYAVPSDADFAPLRDWLEALNGFAALEQTQSSLLDELRRIGSLLNDIVPGTVHLPKRLSDVNSFLEDARAHIQALETQRAALDQQINTLIQQRSVYNVQTAVFSTISAALSETEKMLEEQREMLRVGIRASDEQIRVMREQLQKLQREQNLSGEVSNALQQVSSLLENIRSSRADLNDQKRSVEQALSQTREQRKRLEDIRRRHDQSDPSAPEIERLTQRRTLISRAIGELDQGRVDEINNTIRYINQQRTELQVRRDNALNEWNNQERMNQHRARLQAHLANERQKRIAELRAHRQSLESNV